MGIIDNGTSYKVNKNGHQYYYSKKMYGDKYAKLMAEYSLENDIKIYNWFEEKEDHIIIYSLYKKDNKQYEILIDKDDYNLIKDTYWQIAKDTNEFYAIGTFDNNKKIRMHRYIMNATDPKVLVDHKKGNGLDNRRTNLRLVDTRQNTTNYIHLPKNNKSGILGVYRKESKTNGDAWICNWNEKSTGRRRCKSFAVKKYGEEKAKSMAIEYRNKMMLLHEYTSAIDKQEK